MMNWSNLLSYLRSNYKLLNELLTNGFTLRKYFEKKIFQWNFTVNTTVSIFGYKYQNPFKLMGQLEWVHLYNTLKRNDI